MSEKQATYAVSVIDGIDLQEISQTMSKIGQFQAVIQNQLKQNFDYGVIPGTQKPTLLKPGAEKILMLLGLRSEFEIVDSTRDFEKGFFQYQVKARLYKGNMLITEGLGAANNRERRYQRQDPFTVDNTVLKMAKKRALVDAALLVGSLSDLFTQDLEDMDLQGEKVSTQRRYATDQDGTISKAQARRMFALAKGDADIVRAAIEEKGYEKTGDIKKVDYDGICARIETMLVNPTEGEPPEKETETKKADKKEKPTGDKPVDGGNLSVEQIADLFKDDAPVQE